MLSLTKTITQFMLLYHPSTYVSTEPESGVRVNNFWEKSNAGIEGPKLGAGFEQDCCAGELAIAQTGMLVREDATIVMTA